VAEEKETAAGPVVIAIFFNVVPNFLIPLIPLPTSAAVLTLFIIIGLFFALTEKAESATAIIVSIVIINLNAIPSSIRIGAC
jgi:hypothetical protein